MRTAETADVNDSLPLHTVESVLREHPVQLAILFGSHAKETVHQRSDIDIAVELEDARPGDQGYNESFFQLSADVSQTLGRDDVDLVDLHTLPPAVARAVFEHGILLVGQPQRANELQRQIEDGSNEKSPRERFDKALEKIDGHLQ